MTSLLQKINELDIRVDGLDSSNLQTQITTNSNDISTLQIDKQDILIAGDNITIVDNVISSSLPTSASFSTIISDNIETTKFNGYAAIITVAIAKLDEGGSTLYAKGCTVTRTGAGQYRCNFTSTMPTLDYVVHLTSMEGTDRGDIIILFKQGTALTTRFEYYIVEQDNGTTAGAYVDKPHFISVFI